MAKILNAIVNQAINEFMRPAVEKIPPAALQIMKKVGFDKILPVVSILFTSLFPKEKYSWGEALNDFTTEITAELRRIINEKVGEASEEDATAGSQKSADGYQTLSKLLLNPQVFDEIDELLASISALFLGPNGKPRPEKEIKQIMAIFASLEPENLYVFLRLQQLEQQQYLNLYLKKTEEKSLEEAIKDFKKDVAKLKEGGHIVYLELLSPVLKKIDSVFGGCGLVDERTAKLIETTANWRARAEAFRDRHRRR